MNGIQFIIAGMEHIQLLIDNRVNFLTEYWGTQPEEAECELRLQLKKYFEKEIPDREFVAWLAMDGDRCVGAGGMKISSKPGSFRIPDGRSAYIMNMFTLPEYRRQGIGQEILSRLMKTGEDMGIRFFELHATEEGEPLYIKQGFLKHKEPTYRLFKGTTI